MSWCENSFDCFPRVYKSSYYSLDTYKTVATPYYLLILILIVRCRRNEKNQTMVILKL